ncbi:MAG: double-strand break repair helicase AddA [Hyphomonadaceae bacterium]|nr:double-strand break repair helicase AddA [Hyphomonadaceae bacterium]MBC6412356.1 double-strand break repair helicase AddA [Hyphomonadaceae bacterium]
MTGTVFDDPNVYQRMAADPIRSVFVSANAGSGKTKVLVDRVSRLLLRGPEPVAPDKILCLTYTKAAATEMQSRLFEKLGEWSVMVPDRLNASLDDLMGETQVRSDRELSKARELFARALETPGGLKVQTIHAFCERVLDRFPIEAGIIPGFEPMDEAQQQVVIDQVKKHLLTEAWGTPDGDLGQAISRLAAETANQTFDNFLSWAAHNSKAIEDWQMQGGTQTLAGHLNLSPDDTRETVLQRFWADTDLPHVREVTCHLSQSENTNDRAKAEKLLGVLENPTVDDFDAYADVFLTQKGQKRAGVVTSRAPRAARDFFGLRGAPEPPEMSRVFVTAQAVMAVKCLELTRAAFELARTFSREFIRVKRRARKLDFDDLINLVRQLLENHAVADWVRYKLDGGIDHILIDEAQDTSRAQWDIINALQEGFPQTDPKSLQPPEKTVFAVGDEKQSIYSFQGAQPEVFLGRIRQDKVEQNSVRMGTSFRSSPDILAFVDHTFNADLPTQMFDLNALGIGSLHVQHSAFWRDRGRVDLWPLSPRPDVPDDEVPWQFPVNAPERASAREKLAVAIARQIRTWLDRGEPVFDRLLKNEKGEKGMIRALQAKDILVLVRRRNDFFDSVIRHLKRCGVPVAGADRLVLRESIVVKDLLALTRFVLLPSDDLSLAEVLRSPLINLSEVRLFDLAHDRGKVTLWAALCKKTDDDFRAVTACLKTIQTLSSRYAPHEFYARVLDMDGTFDTSIRKQIFSRLGQESEDAMNAFLARALDHQRRGAPSLHHFLHDFSNDDQNIKREMEASHNEVRVMTVHGAKGLEAPVVILPDTTQTPDSGRGRLLYPFDEGFVYLPGSAQTPESLSRCREAVKAAGYREYLRLLYVAMTRAESRLVICGHENGNAGASGYRDGCWYDLLSRTFNGLQTREMETPFGKGLCFGTAAGSVEVASENTEAASITLPGWINRPAPKEVAGLKTATPSQLLATDGNNKALVRSPISQSPDRFLRGNIIHRLLEILPDMDIEHRASVAQDHVKKYSVLSDVQAVRIIEEVFAVLDHPDHALIFAPGSKAEINLAGTASNLPDHLHLNAQIDRLAVINDQVHIIDYKSDRLPPTKQDDVPDTYWGQMVAYREMVRDIYPDHTIHCGLLWTDGPHLMWLDHDRLNTVLTRIAALPTSWGA